MFNLARFPGGAEYAVSARPAGALFGNRDPDVMNTGLARVAEWIVLWRRRWTVSVRRSPSPFERRCWKERQANRQDAEDRAEELCRLITSGAWEPTSGPPP